MIEWSIVDWQAVGQFIISVVAFGPLCIIAACLIMDWMDNH